MLLKHPNTGKTNRFGGFGPFFRVFRIFRSFAVFPFFRISAFSVFWGGRVSEETVPQHSVCFHAPRPLPNLKPLTLTAKRTVENTTMQVNRCCWFTPKPSINADTDVLCVSTEATGRSGQRTEALRATQHASQAWTAIKGF